MKKIVSCMAALLLMLTLFAGCGKKSVVGRWRYSFEDDYGLRSIFYEFREDGGVTCVMDGHLMFESIYEVQENRLAILRADGETYYMFTFSFEDGNLLLKDGSTVTEYEPYHNVLSYQTE